MNDLQSPVNTAQVFDARANRSSDRLQSLVKAAKDGTPANESAARKAAEEFEAVFVSQMINAMFSGIKTDGPFGGGHGEKMFRSLINQEYAKSIVQQGGLGIADNVMREIQRLQER